MNTIASSQYFGLVFSVFLYLLAVRLKARLRLAILNPLLVTVALLVAFLLATGFSYEDYAASASLLSYLLTPATVCLAIPLYRRLSLLRDNVLVIAVSITVGTVGSVGGILAVGRLAGLSRELIATLLPKSITTAIGMGVSQEAGGIVTLTVAAIILTGILGNVVAEPLFRLLHITHPIAKGLALGTGAHAVGTAKALELGEIEGAMSSLSICVAGIETVILVPLLAEAFL